MGTTNKMIMRSPNHADAVIDVGISGGLQLRNAKLRRQLSLTTSDLRFADILVKAVLAAPVEVCGVYLWGQGHGMVYVIQVVAIITC